MENRYPDVALEEVERVFEYLDLSLDANTVGLDEKSRMCFEVLNTIFHYAEDCGRDCDCGGKPKKMTEYPDWVQAFYWRAQACEAR